MLKRKSITYEVINDVDKMVDMGIASVPCLVVNEKVLDYVSAKEWITAQ